MLPSDTRHDGRILGRFCMLHLVRHHRARLEAIALAIIGVVLAYFALVYELHEKLDHLVHENGWFVVDQLTVLNGANAKSECVDQRKDDFVRLNIPYQSINIVD
ncbi:hypothetical protein ACFYE9_32985 [Rhizobium leguminosarum]|uniref:Uncharacterized protein n=2 Tax=Rhizobium leguminosarum TaxID=384 RepID=A0A154I8E8_RHILE|nr:hypothetical protein [Rhizobium leguminosarum]KZA96863.1 hypothetical protein A4A59_33960 [Rhizobium leguminosarum]